MIEVKEALPNSSYFRNLINTLFSIEYLAQAHHNRNSIIKLRLHSMIV